MFYNQPLAIRFGTELLRHIGDDERIEPFWDSLDIAVAWVRSSGVSYLTDRLANFLSHGGQLSIIVGIDLQNTTREGLQSLLDLEEFGNSETYVYHNEGGSVFHPKLYLFRNEEEARLIVGSNNITKSGLYMNVEAGLQVDTNLDASVIEQTLDAISSWKDTSSDLAKRLTPGFLDQLSSEGYVPEEASAREQMRQSRVERSSARNSPLFGSRQFAAPVLRRATPAASDARRSSPEAQPPSPSQQGETLEFGKTLLMRLRKASATSRPTQTQIPFRVVSTFFQAATEVRSVHSDAVHEIHIASARGKPNTMKLEIPEMRDFAQPMARFEKTGDGIVYEIYDLGTPQGNQIQSSLEEGRHDNTTQMSIKNSEKATWWRFI